ncbi:MAG: alpha-amylase family glycosyl hydrolase [Desulfobacterales bacterium]|nr:alpha-amylase family glycosyl hydrolase [Desulfobacterales bacterium]
MVGTTWPRQPIIYEFNTWVWLYELSQKHNRLITLGSVPEQEWDTIASLGVDAVWLMGVWERSPAGIRISLEHPGLQAEYQKALPDVSLEDVVGSPYCIRRYGVDEHLGGPEGLATARGMLAERGIRLILDFVPNHVAPDHPWVYDHPEYFIQGNMEELRRAPAEYFEANGNIIACGRDPTFPPWTDTAQLNAFHHGLRQAMIETVGDIANQCDGMRCDMAMLLLNSIFERTWGSRAGTHPASEYWADVIHAVRMRHPRVLFMAEAYWDLEWDLQQQGFDYCYDKRLYDRLVHEGAESVRLHLLADRAYQEKLVRFIENHDEPRAAATLPSPKSRAGAVTILTLPGAKLLNEGQFEGRRVKLPVQLGRRPAEPVDRNLQAFYHQLLKTVGTAGFHEAEWKLCERSGWPDNPSYLNLVAWCWRREEEKHLIVVNLSDRQSQGRVRLSWEGLVGRSWRMIDILTGELYERDGHEMLDPGLYVDLEAWRFHFLKF